jgi:hypothetical protein
MGESRKVMKVTKLFAKLFEDNICLNNAVKYKR